MTAIATPPPTRQAMTMPMMTPVPMASVSTSLSPPSSPPMSGPGRKKLTLSYNEGINFVVKYQNLGQKGSAIKHCIKTDACLFVCFEVLTSHCRSQQIFQACRERATASWRLTSALGSKCFLLKKTLQYHSGSPTQNLLI